MSQDINLGKTQFIASGMLLSYADYYSALKNEALAQNSWSMYNRMRCIFTRRRTSNVSVIEFKFSFYLTENTGNLIFMVSNTDGDFNPDDFNGTYEDVFLNGAAIDDYTKNYWWWSDTVSFLNLVVGWNHIEGKFTLTTGTTELGLSVYYSPNWEA